MRWIGWISLLLLSGLLTAVPVSASEARTPAVGKIGWKPCPEDTEVDCGKVSVPIDWAHPGGSRINITVARKRAGDPRHRIGSLFLLPGGPGGSGVDFALIAREFLAPEMLRRFDIVGFDARGIDRSHPVVCPTDQNQPSEFPRNAEEYKRLLESHRRLAETCRRLTGPVFDHVDTLSAARDLDVIRQALGQRQISLYGGSYGTMLGAQYAEEYPRRVRALVLDANMDHSLTDARRYLIPLSRVVEQGYRRFSTWCADSPRCALRGQNVFEVLDRLMARAERGELSDPDNPGAKIRPEDLSETIRRAMYGTSDWVQLSEYLAKLQTAKRLQIPDWLPPSYHAILCSDFSFPIRDFKHVKSLMAASRRVAPHTRVNYLGWIDLIGCQGFTQKTRNPQRPYRVRSTPILMTNSRYDPATPYSWATNVARQIPGAVLLTYDGIGHTNYLWDPCVTAAIDRYLLTLVTPPPGTHCPATPPPISGEPSRPDDKFPSWPR